MRPITVPPKTSKPVSSKVAKPALVAKSALIATPAPADTPSRPEASLRSLRVWPPSGPLLAAFVGVGAVGVLIGRVSAPARESPATAQGAATTAQGAATTAQGAATTAPSAATAKEPQQFDLTEEPRSKVGIALRPMDRDIFALITSLDLDRPRMADVFPDRPYRVAFVGSLAEKHIGMVMVDLDRDGKFDERWDLKREGVSRVVQKDPAAGGQPVMYTLSHGRWQVH